MNPTNNTYDFIHCESNKKMISTAIRAITELELWEYLRNFDEESFMFSKNKNVEKIYNEIENLGYTGHSGTSFAFTMRQMEYIAKHGFNEFREKWIQYETNRNNRGSPRSVKEIT